MCRFLADFCEKGRVSLISSPMSHKIKFWSEVWPQVSRIWLHTDSPNSQTITEMISSGHFRLTSGQTSWSKFYFRNFYCIKSCALKLQKETPSWEYYLGIFFAAVVIHEDISGKQPSGRNLPKTDATVKISFLDSEGRFIPLYRRSKTDW